MLRAISTIGVLSLMLLGSATAFAQSAGDISAVGKPSNDPNNGNGAPATSEAIVSTGAPTSPPMPLDSLANGSYIYDTLRVINNTNTRGCNNGDYNCMANICKGDLGASAWRGWGGCYANGGTFICYFECSQIKSTF